MLRVPLLGDRIAECVRRHRLMKRGVEHGDLRQIWPEDADGIDAGEVRRVVQRRQVTDRAQRGEDCIVYQDRGAEPLSAVHHPVTRSEQANATVRGCHQLEHPGHHRVVIASGKLFFNGRRRKPLNPQHGLGRTEPLAHPRHETLPGGGVHERELDGRTARVQHQHPAVRRAAHGSLPGCLLPANARSKIAAKPQREPADGTTASGRSFMTFPLACPGRR